MRIDRATFPLRGLALIDCLVYFGLFTIILGVAILAFDRAARNSKALHRHAADIVRALHAGERWRADLRACTAEPRLEQRDGETRLVLPRPAGDIRYAFRAGAVFRQALPATNWSAVLPEVRASEMRGESRRFVRVWQWDVELKSRDKVIRTPPVFSFRAVVAAGAAPPG